MPEPERLSLIEQRLKANEYFVNPHSDVNVREDLEYLLTLARDNAKKIKILATQVMELTQEMENVKSDFGGDQR